MVPTIPGVKVRAAGQLPLGVLAPLPRPLCWGLSAAAAARTAARGSWRRGEGLRPGVLLLLAGAGGNTCRAMPRSPIFICKT